MSLTSSQYQTIQQLYEERRLSGEKELVRRKEQLYDKVPALAEIDEQLIHGSVQAAKLALEGNNASLVMQLATPAARALFMGDAEREVEEELVSIEGARLESEVLKVGHHGSKTSSALPFLAEVRPMRAVVSVGSRNNHGHPDAAVLADLALVLDGAARVLRTDELSDVEIVFGPAGFYEKDLGEETAEAWARW